MSLGDLLAKLSADPVTNAAIIGVVVLALLDFATGTLRAIADKSFTWDALDVWVRKTIAGRVVPIILVLLAGTVVGNVTVGSTSFGVLTAAALVAAGTFAATSVASIVENLSASAPNPTPVE